MFYCVMGCNDGFLFPWESVWQTKVPLREAFFAWLATLRKILTMENRRKHVLLWLIGVVCVK
jgi:hypothetical protein